MKTTKRIAFVVLLCLTFVAGNKGVLAFSGWLSCGYLCWEIAEEPCVGWSGCVTLQTDCEYSFCGEPERVMSFSCNAYQEGGTGNWFCEASCECREPGK